MERCPGQGHAGRGVLETLRIDRRGGAGGMTARRRSAPVERTVMTAVYTWDVFSTVDGYGSYVEGADWGGYWSKQGPELLEHRAAQFETEQRLVFGATTFRETAGIWSSGIDPNLLDEWNLGVRPMPGAGISPTLQGTPGRPGAST